MAEIDKNKKLVNLGALEKVAGALKTVANKAAADAATEKERAMAAEQAILEKANANAAAIAILNGDAEGSVAKAVADAVNVEKLRAEGVEAGFETRIAKNEAFVNAQPAKDKAQDDRLDIIEEMMGLGGAAGDKTAIEELQDSIEAAQQAANDAQADVNAVVQRLDAENGLVARIAANEGALEVLNGDENAEGSVKKQIAAAVAGEKGRAEAQEALIRQEFANVDTAIRGEMETEAARVNKKIADDIAAESALRVAEEQRIEGKVNAEVQRADAEEKRIVGLVEAEAQTARAAEAANKAVIDKLDGTVDDEGSVKKQIADAIAGVKSDVTDGLANRVTTAENQLKIIQGDAQTDGSIAKAEANAKAYADQKVADLVNGAPETLDTLDELAAALRDNADVLTAIETTFNGKLDNKVDKVEGSRLISETEAAGYAAKAEVDDVEQALQDAKDYADDQDAVIQESVRGLAEVVGKKAEGENAATGIFAEMATMKSNCEKAMEDEVAARNKAIADELIPYAKTDAMKQFVGNVVSSLSLDISETQIVLKLGDGVEGVTVAKAEFNIATDEEINAILGDLVQDQGE
jgi:hypothetical protein